MELITMDSKVLETIIKKLSNLEKNFEIAINKKAQLENKYADMTEASHLLGLSPRTIFKLIKKGDIECTKYNRKIRFRVSDIEKFLEKQS